MGLTVEAALGLVAIGRSGLLHGMTAELVAKRREDPSGVAFLLPAAETCQQRERDHRGRDVEINRLLYGTFTLLASPYSPEHTMRSFPASWIF